jgi:hypothetical protein
MASSLSPHIEKLSAQLRESAKKLSRREKILVLLGGLFVAVSAGNVVYGPIREAFTAQESRYEETAQQLQYVAAALSRFQKLRIRRDEIEKDFREVEIEEGALSYLEDLVKTKAGVVNPQISPRDIRDFGSEYEQAPFLIRFPIVDLARLVQFLEELVQGKKPFILASLDIKRRPAGDSLDVELEVSSLRRKKSP